ncbi:MAG: acetyl-CoA carboxylase, carboxyltransferase subunit beta [Endomicrobium sp.]|jgi:acetyl-CoA carboxylase carboxyl transferase subunit beta|nr:acetyl-CoA carboxylase, carboxyltransferase subunit beta [Endomicrobium sp.]
MTKKKDTVAKIWTRCKKCEQIFLLKDLQKNLMVCPKCGYYTRLDAYTRIHFTFDKDSFQEFDTHIQSVNFLNFPGYTEKLQKCTTVVSEAVVTGLAKLYENEVVIAVMDFSFMGGSMGSVVGEKITRAIEYALQHDLHIIIFSASGGARMQEGIISLMQMGKISSTLAQLASNRLAYISVLTDPTTGGVAASYAFLGDIIIAEPQALIGFAGPRVIEQTMKQRLPKGFQSAEFLEKHGMIDIVVERKDMRIILGKILKFFNSKKE